MPKTKKKLKKSKKKLTKAKEKPTKAIVKAPRHLKKSKKKNNLAKEFAAELGIKLAKLEPVDHNEFLAAVKKVAKKRGYAIQAETDDALGLTIKASFVGKQSLIIPAIEIKEPTDAS